MIYISLVSHGHSSIIHEIGCINSLSDDCILVIKNNKIDDVGLLGEHAYIIDECYGLGFGHNNNIVYQYCVDNFGMLESDYFIVLNPDVLITSNVIKDLVNTMKNDDVNIAAINLFRDELKTIYDNSIRQFPSFIQFVSSFLRKSNTSIIDKSKVYTPIKIDWAAGSFLAFQAGHYRKLMGFDQSYFMYCEDIDICYRSSIIGYPVTYYPQFEAIHLAKHANRKFLSKHFMWHVCSAVRFLFSKSGYVTMKSILKK
ncbi:glycosyltransferase family 2 protein [Vibrio hibernica]|uniref:glycosyltransferase family 2 protein n=1 Tax=Vibrio hibernica TaxID=2587465 RepID=UPI0018929482|nr:glycosyltransferase family 2 protein [Vibrio hibernica]